MRTAVSIAFALALIATLIAAVYAGPTPEMINDKEIRLAEKVASITYAHKNNCDLMGAKLGRLMADNAALISDAKELTPELKKQGERRYRARGRTIRAKIGDGFIKCHANANVKAAIDKVRTLASSIADDGNAPATDGNNARRLGKDLQASALVNAE